MRPIEYTEEKGFARILYTTGTGICKLTQRFLPIKEGIKRVEGELACGRTRMQSSCSASASRQVTHFSCCSGSINSNCTFTHRVFFVMMATFLHRSQRNVATPHSVKFDRAQLSFRAYKTNRREMDKLKVGRKVAF